MPPNSVIQSDPEIMGGTPVFRGTRVLFQAPIGYFEADHPVDDFLNAFPTVSRAQAIPALDQAKDMLLADAQQFSFWDRRPE